jgi:hypothetical protein
MKQFYDNQDDEMRSRLSGHEFNAVPGSWDKMEQKLDKLEVPSMSKSMVPWLSLGTMLVGVTALMFYYRLQMPFGKTEPILVEENKDLKGEKIADRLNNLSASSTLRIESTPKNNTVENTISEQKSKDKLTKGNDVKNRIIEPAIISQSIKSDKQLISNLPQKLDPLAMQRGANIISDDDSFGEKQSDKHFNDVEDVVTTDLLTVDHSANILPIISIVKIENKAFLSLDKLADTPLLVLKTPHSIAVKKLKFGISAGLNTKIYADNDYSIAPAAGIFVRRYFNNKIALQGDLQYKMLIKKKQNQAEEASLMNMQMDVDPSVEILMHNKTAEVHNIKEMHMIELPISFVYRLHKKHNISLGINTACLFGVKTAVREIDNLSEKELGFSSIDLGALAAYEFKLNKNLAISVSYNVGFLNLARNAKARQQEMIASNPSYRLDRTESDEACLMPVQLNDQEQIFFEAPSNLYNTDAKVMLRYSF